MSESYGEYEARMSAKHNPGTLRYLRCSCCGEAAGRWKQWHNKDTGYGVCLRCVTWMRQEGRETEENIRRLYGVEGENWGARVKVYERTYRAVACFYESDAGMAAANAWMELHRTHGLIATQDGYYWLAELNDKGVVE